MDLPGIAIKDFYIKNSASKLWIHDHFGPKVEMPIETYFRTEQDFPSIEKEALKNCKGSILDIGAGAGAHALYLQNKKQDITALEISSASCEVMKDRGVLKIIQDDFFTADLPKYDTLLLLMNGIGICGKIENIPSFLNKAKSILNPGGQIIFDSSDISYMYEETEKSSHYYGEVSYQYSYKRLKTDWFNWLYIDNVTMRQIAEEHGWKMNLLAQDSSDQYLAQLILS